MTLKPSRARAQVEASLRTGTHYCDIAGEVHWMRKTVSTLHAAARAKNVKIVHSCGFDSVPSDLGAYLLAQHMRTELERPCARIDMLVNEVKGGFSGGSLQSMFEQYMQPADEIQDCSDPYCLNPMVRSPRLPTLQSLPPPRRWPAVAVWSHSGATHWDRQ